ncbi:MAG TPA: polysaccharide deacetylase family protein [Cytophagaceae bacterium]
MKSAMLKPILLLSFLILSLLACKSVNSGKSDKKVKHFWVDQFDVKSGQGFNKEYWYVITDKGNGGASVISPLDIKSAYTLFPERNNNQGLKFTYELKKGNFNWPYVAFGLPVKNDTTIGSIGTWEGIAYDFKGSNHTFIYQTTNVKDYAYFQKTVFESEEWKTVVIPFAQLKQPQYWGKQVEFDRSLIQGLAWNITGKDGDTGSICIDNVRFLKRIPEDLSVLETTYPATELTNNKNYEVQEEQEIKTSLVQKDEVNSNSQIQGKVKIATWYEFKKAAYSLTFDDGLISQYKYVLPVLDKYNLKATFYLITGSLQEDPEKSPDWRFGYWYQFLEMAQKGHELGSHTVTHPRLTSLELGNESEKGTLKHEISHSYKAIQTKLPGYQPLSFAYPFVDFDSRVMDETSKHYVAARALGTGVNGKNPDWMQLQAQLLEYTSGRTLDIDKQKFTELQTWIKNTIIPSESWSIYLAHDVLPFEEAIKATDCWHPVSAESFENFVQWLKEQQDQELLWVETVANITKYIRERQTVRVSIIEETESVLKMELTDTLPDDIYNFPLSLEVSVPDSWDKVTLKYMGTTKILPVADGKVRFNAVPDTGIIELAGHL